MTQETVEKIFEAVAETAPHIYSGLLHRREYIQTENPSSEDQLEADIWANELLKEKITCIDGVGEYASEEEREVTDCGEGLSVAVDPLDGSSNIPTNNIVGTIVAVYDEKLPCSGRNIVSAFYVVFGPLISIVRAENGEVNEYVVEGKKSNGIEIYLASEGLKLPEPKLYGFGGNNNWTENFRKFENKISEQYKLRYGGALVGDFNQILHYGGIFAYPSCKDAENGKYRLLFEGNPMAYIAEMAGGASTDGEKSILDVEAEDLHQRVPFHAGNTELINRLEEELKN